MFFHVYLLRSKLDNSFYIGFAEDLKERMEKHNKGMVQSTKNLRPMELIYFESYKSKRDALIREKRLKQFAKGFSSLKSRLFDSLMLEG
ncbi:GIY-YIG nuclease family protein [Candidatus Wolfebacteria bacterium]|nr:GIY-YIG nuclease family protein [Candidatus Wolfebacteria bacterium]